MKFYFNFSELNICDYEYEVPDNAFLQYFCDEFLSHRDIAKKIVEELDIKMQLFERYEEEIFKEYYRYAKLKAEEDLKNKDNYAFQSGD